MNPPVAELRSSTWAVFLVFLRLGVTSFGGPIAHLGYFRDEFVQRRRWLSDAQYADLVALCQFLPGPASSQVGFAVGLQRAGIRGALAAWVGFTMPSALLLFGFAYGASWLNNQVGAGLLSGLKVVAVAVVAHALLGMATKLTPDGPRATIAVVATVVVVASGNALGQLGAILIGIVAGAIWLRRIDADGNPNGMPARISVRSGIACLGGFGILLLGLPLLAGGGNRLIEVADGFYRAGALVFGGGHVVLPLLEAEVVTSGWVTAEQFLAGYGAAQAVPGPLFTFASYLGALAAPGTEGIATSLVALVAIFLPGMLLLVGVWPFWARLQALPSARACLAGANAAVVGILAVAFYDPVFTTAIVDPATFCLALGCFVLLVAWRVPPWVVVIVGAIGGLGIAIL